MDGCNDVSPQLLSSRLNYPSSFSLCPQQRCFSPWINFLARLWSFSKRSTSFLCGGSQTWTWYSIWDFTRAEQRAMNASLTLLTTTLLMKPSILLACWAASTHCSSLIVIVFSLHLFSQVEDSWYKRRIAQMDITPDNTYLFRQKGNLKFCLFFPRVAVYFYFELPLEKARK